MSPQSNLLTLREHAQEILRAALDAVDPEEAVRSRLRPEGRDLLVGAEMRRDLGAFDRVLVVGAGKASAAMARAVEEVLGDKVIRGIVCVKYGHGLPLKRVEVLEAGHPLPDRAGEQAATRIVGLLESAGSRDLVISCISGGGSALLPLSAVGLEEKIELTGQLLASGADIHEMNAVRKHISLTKGGRLMAAAFPATVVNLVLSDVIGDDLDTIASGPFVPDGSTFQDALEILDRYGLMESAPKKIVKRLEEGAKGLIPETPKEGDEIFERCLNLIVGSNILCLEAAASKARELGYESIILSSRVRGDTSQAALFHAALAEEIHASANPVKPPACVLSGGETTVKVVGQGLGGRNQEFALCLVEQASTLPNTLFLSAGTDGTDGPTDAAGAVADTTSLVRAKAMGLDPREFLRNNDSYHFFEPLGDLIITGPTRTNVMDLRIVMVGARG